MSISPGTRFGAYEVVEPIGAGGMGEVWRARDVELKRDVAVKVLPESFAADADRLARFRREAEILASLNHANIAQVFGLERCDDRMVIVMELVDGATLAERIAGGPLPADEAIDVGLQIVAALEAAHERGIVHRDLKPANVKVRPDGTVKVLDFGISKPIDPIGDTGEAISGSPAMTTPAATQAGVILGTAAYMSPEQARGRPVDERTDVWAFGCVLFEMLTGQPAFGGEDVMLTLARVLDRETDLSRIPPAIGPAIRRTIALCLEKDPRRRIADVRDVRLALEGRFESESERAVTQAPRHGVRRPALTLAAAFVAGAVLAGLGAWSLRPADAPRGLVRFDHPLGAGRTFNDSTRDVIALSADGRRLAYSASDGVYVRAIDDPEARFVTDADGAANNLFFSPDGEWIGYWHLLGARLEKIRVTGGSPLTLMQSQIPQGATWTADGRIVVALPLGIVRIDADGGAQEMLIPSTGNQFRNPQVLPDGSIVFAELRGGSGVIVVETPGAGDRTELFAGERAVYLPTGHLATTDASSPGTLFVRAFDVATRAVGGPVPIEDGVWGNHFAVASGTLALARGPEVRAEDVVLALVDRAGNVDPLDVAPAAYRGPRVSPDGSTLAVEVIGDNQRSSIWLHDLTGSRAPRQLLGAGSNTRPLWTPDGRRLTYASDRGGAWGVWWQPVDGSGVAEQLTAADEGVEYWPDAWSPDGRTLVLTRIDGSLGSIQNQSLWTVSVDENGRSREPEALVDFQAGGASVSPNGRWVAYRSTDPGVGATNQLHVQPLPPTGVIHAVTDRGGSYPIWSGDGSELLFRRPTTSGDVPLALAVLDVDSGQSFAWGNENEISIPGGVDFFGYRGFDFLPDGNRLVASIDARASERAAADSAIRITTSWHELVTERVPGN